MLEISIFDVCVSFVFIDNDTAKYYNGDKELFEVEYE